MKNKLSPKAWLLIALLFSGARSLAQNITAPKVPAQPPPNINRVYLMNKGQIPLIIYVSYDDKIWSADTLIPKAATPYKMYDKFFIKVYTTTTNYVEYPLAKGKKYSIEWSDEGNKFDVYEIVSK